MVIKVAREYRQGLLTTKEETEICVECGKELKVKVLEYKVICSDGTTNYHTKRESEVCDHEVKEVEDEKGKN